MEIPAKKMKTENMEKIISSNQKANTYNELNEFRKTGLFCNFTINFPDKSSYPVHKSVIAAGCPYFKSLFNFEKNPKSETIPREIPPNIFENILEFIYTGETEIKLEDALILHENAIYFSLNTLKDSVCLNFLIQNIQMDTCLNYWRGAVFDKILREKCTEFIALNGEEFFDKYLFNLTYEELNEILSIETLNCPEEKLYLFVIKWLKEDYKNRENNFNDLLNNLRFCSISPDEKVNLIAECCEFKNSLEVLANIFKKNLEPEQSSNYSNKSLRPRIGNRTKSIFCVSKTSIAKLDNNRKFTTLLNIQKTDGFKIKSFAENYLLISGGSNSNICEYYCPIKNILKPFPKMIENRSHHGIITLNNVICAAGGCGSGKTTEQFHLNWGSWIKGPDFNNARRDFDLISWDSCFYAFGGGSNIIERLDSRENKWIELDTSTNLNLGGFKKSLTIDDSIYCFSQDTIKVFDIRQNKWISDIAYSISTAGYRIDLSSFEVIYFNKSIYMGACGRENQRNSNVTYFFFEYDINTKQWKNTNYNTSGLYTYNTSGLYSLSELYH